MHRHDFKFFLMIPHYAFVFFRILEDCCWTPAFLLHVELHDRAIFGQFEWESGVVCHEKSVGQKVKCVKCLSYSWGR